MPSSSPPSTPPSSPSPSLPYDILRLVAAGAAGEAADSEEREAAHAVSLVCRDLRNVGQGALWSTLSLPSRRMERLLDEGHLRRLLPMVHRLRWDEDIDDWRRDDPDFRSVVEVFARVAHETENLRAVELDEPPAEYFGDFLSAILSSPSSRTITSFSVGGTAVSFTPGGSDVDEAALVRFLGALPALSSFNCQFSHLPAPPTLPPTSDPLPRLSLQHVKLNSKRKDRVADTLTPSTPYHILASALNVSTLVTVATTRAEGRDGWIRWLSQPGFSALQSLTIDLSSGNGVFPSLTILSSCLAFHQSLLRLTIMYAEWYSGARLTRRWHEIDTPPFRNFLFSLPPTLQSLSFDFEVPTDDVLDDYLQNGPTMNLWYFECLASPSEQLQLVWDPELREFVETVRPFDE